MKLPVYWLLGILFLSGLVPTVLGQPEANAQLFLITQDGKSGYIDQTGRIVIVPQFGGAWDFHEGRTCVQPMASRHSKYQVIDTAGIEIIPEQFSACGPFSEGLGAVAVDTEKTRSNCMDCDPFFHWGYIDRAGKLVMAGVRGCDWSCDLIRSLY